MSRSFKSLNHQITKSHNTLVLAAVCGAYLAIELVYVHRLPLVMDEFNDAARVYRLASAVPYRDFAPYKTVLGWYFQLPALVLAGDIWSGLMAAKTQMALTNTLVLGVAAWLLSRRFDYRNVLAALVLLFAMSTFLERSSALRTDMLTALFGLLSLVLLLDRRMVGASILCALSFLVSQKGAYYVLASDAALLLWLAAARRREVLREAVLFNIAMACLLGLYIAAWSVPASPGRVLHDTFTQHFSHYGSDFEARYAEAELYRYWLQTIARNPVYYALAAGALLVLASRCLRRRITTGRTEWLLLGYGVALAAFCLNHGGSWPYFFVIVIPTCFVLHVYFFEAIKLFVPGETTGLRRGRLAFIIALIALGVVFPLTRVPKVLARDQAFQRHMVELAEAIIQPGDTYIDGCNMLYKTPQAVEETAWLDMEARLRLRGMSEAELETLIDKIDRERVKFIIWSKRFDTLPERLKRYLHQSFAPLWGALYVYAPTIESGYSRIEIEFAGTYTLKARPGARVAVGDTRLVNGDRLDLDAGVYPVTAERRCRLVFQPAGFKQIADSEHYTFKPLFNNPYRY